MNDLTRFRLSESDLQRRARIFTTLEQVCQELELSKTQFERAQQAYEAIAKWLADSNDPLLVAVQVYLHGSGALGTTVKPIGQEEYDVDLIAFAAAVSVSVSPAALKKAVGARLAEHGTYVALLEEKTRCWRLNYAGDIHLDISPTISNPRCFRGGELVPDRKLRAWHPTNPKAYRELFEARAQMVPRFTRPLVSVRKDHSSIEPFPARASIKGILRRAVQLLKRHRDEFFLETTDEVAPISIIITTLAMQAYEYCVRRHAFEDELEVLVETIRMMPWFIDKPILNGSQIYAVWNETTSGENFADRWNTQPARVEAFYRWHAKALADFEALRDAIGLDAIARQMQLMLGERVVKKVIGAQTDVVSRARQSEKLLVAPALGLSTLPSAAATPVPRNDFFGD